MVDERQCCCHHELPQVSMSTRTGQWSPVDHDPYTYACGSPTLKNRRKYLSLDQLFALCKELKIMPDSWLLGGCAFETGDFP